MTESSGAVLLLKTIQTVHRKHKLYEDLFRCRYNLSGIYQRNGDFVKAVRFAGSAIECAVTMKDKLSEREGLILKGKV